MSDPADESMQATYRALCEHGYADVTMQAIADETDKSKAALHYHYDSKRDLLMAFLDFLYEEFTERVGAPAADKNDPDAEPLAAAGPVGGDGVERRSVEVGGRDGDAAARLLGFIDRVLDPPEDDPERRREFQTAMLELKAQAPYDEAVRERMARFDAFLVRQVQALVEAGVESGVFRAVDPEDTARFIVTALDGAHTKQVAVGRDTDCTRRMLHGYVKTHLLADGHGGVA
jgi:Bacterial regulatory proteins, tetR family.